MNSKQQQGISLVELMVSLLLSTFFILVVSTLYLNSNKNHRYQKAETNNNQNASLVSIYLKEFIARAGYKRNPTQANDEAFPYVAGNNNRTGVYAGCATFEEGAVITGLNQINYGSASGELGFCTRYQPALRDEVDCEGNLVKLQSESVIDTAFLPTAHNELVVLKMTFKFNQDLNQGQLICRNTNSSVAGNHEAVLVDGIAMAYMEYVVRPREESSDRIPSSFIPFHNWRVNSRTKSYDNDIVGINFNLLLSSEMNIRDFADSKILNDWIKLLQDKKFNNKAEFIKSNDKQRIYRSVNDMQISRNLIP